MTRRDPLTEIENLLERMGREFEELGGTLDGSRVPDTPSLPGIHDLAVDVIEDDESITVIADLPGFDDDDIEVELHDDALSITATREEETTVSIGDDEHEPANDRGDDETPHDDGVSDETAVRYHRRERRIRSVSRRVAIPAPVERDGASASYDAGVLTVTLPKRSETDSSGHSIDVS